MDNNSLEQNINKLEEQLRESQAFFQISQMLAHSLDLPTILRQIVDASVSLIANSEQAVIHLINENKSLLRPVAVARPSARPKHTPILFRPGEGIAGLVMEKSTTIYVEDTLKDHRFLLQDQNAQIYRSLMVAPIKLNQDIIGTLSVESKMPFAFSAYYERILTNLGEQAALAIERAHILQEEQEQRLLAEALREASNIQGSNADFNTVMERILQLVRNVVPYDAASVMFIDGDRATITHAIGHDRVESTNPLEFEDFHPSISAQPHLKQMADTGKPVVIQDISDKQDWVSELPDARSWIGVPIQAQGRVIAFLSLSKLEPGFYQPSHADRLLALAGQASLTIQNSQLFETTQQRLREVNLLYRMSQKLAESLDANVIIQQVINLLIEQFDFYFVQILFLDKENDRLVFRQGSEPYGSILRRENYWVPLNLGITGHVAMTNHSFVSNKISEVPFFTENSVLPLTHAELAVPLRSGDRLIGVLDIHHQPPNLFQDHDLQLIYTIAEQATLAIEKAILYDDLQTTLIKEQAARAQLVQSEKLAALGRIVASVAHELNNPLQAIQNALYLINLEEGLTYQAKDDLQVALNESNRMAGLIARLRETYRPTTSEEFQYYSVNNLIEDVEKLINTHLKRNNITFDFSPDESVPKIPIIMDHMKQVVLNICLNAVESMPEGGMLTIRTHFDAPTKMVRLDIKDSGNGIDPDVLPYIFDPFVTTKDRGTGLGLAITYDIIRRHGGRIEPESIIGKGTLFKLWLPTELPLTPGLDKLEIERKPNT
jgi:signal transduction histidine kinase